MYTVGQKFNHYICYEMNLNFLKTILFKNDELAGVWNTDNISYEDFQKWLYMFIMKEKRSLLNSVVIYPVIQQRFCEKKKIFTI